MIENQLENQQNNLEQIDDSAGANLEPDIRVGLAIYLSVLNEGIMTEHGALLKNGLQMNQIAKQAEVSSNFAIKATANIRKMGFIRNRSQDGRLIVKLTELEAWLMENGATL